MEEFVNYFHPGYPTPDNIAFGIYAELLRRSPWAAATSIHEILTHSVRLSGLLSGDAQVAEFASLVSRASLIQALGKQVFVEHTPSALKTLQGTGSVLRFFRSLTLNQR